MTATDDTRAILSEMTEITEQTIGRTFHRYPDLDTLYHDCPTAFWLAPDGDDVLPPSAGPILPSPAPTAIHEAAHDAPEVSGMTSGIVRAVLAAGPIFAASAVAVGAMEYDRHWWNPLARALATLVAFPLTMTFGALLALLPVLTGALALGAAGRLLPAIRRPAAWAATGGMMGVAIAALFDAGSVVGLALVATSVACAIIARSTVAWIDPDPA